VTAPKASLPAAGALPRALLLEIEQVAIDFARSAGAEIAAGLQREVAVDYKTEARGSSAPTDPVSELDRSIEDQIRTGLAERFPDHGIVGEEVDVHPRPDDEFLWVIDPVDGTTNFVNGFPLFACSIGVLHRGRPVVGAVWCSTSHELTAGVYHAHLDGPLEFEGRALTLRGNAGVKRRLAAAPGGASGRTRDWDNRVTGSAAVECAFVAAGMFNSAAFGAPGIWDVAAGIVLVRAAGLEAWVREPSGRAWRPFDRFEAPSRVREDRDPTLRDWRRSLVLGEPEAVQLRREGMRPPSRWRRLQRWWRRRRARR
jgi:myo-inositol-1(or 4)-monophosphatase